MPAGIFYLNIIIGDGLLRIENMMNNIPYIPLFMWWNLIGQCNQLIGLPITAQAT